MNTTSECDKKTMPWNSADQPSIDNVESGHAGESAPPTIDNGKSGHVGGSSQLKKGPWTSAEDAILVDYVLKHGEGRWNNIHRDSVLARCGKSCRLRWINHLRPNLKKGAFTRAEERKVVELHAMMGNKWSLMAAELPGRTDNEIKNFWNTRVKRHRRNGLPLYPPGIIPHSLNQNQHNDDTNAFSARDPYCPNFLPDDNVYIPALDFISPEHNQPLCPPSIPNITASSLHSQIQNVYDHGLTTNHASSSSLFIGSHAVINGNLSSLNPAQALLLELPSIQTQTSCLGMVQTRPTECTQSCDLATDGSDLLEALLKESGSMNIMKNNYHQWNLHASDTATDDGDLLEAVLNESGSMNNMKNSYRQQNSHASDVATDGGDFLEAVLNESRSMNNMKNNYHPQISHASDIATDGDEFLEAVLNESRSMNNMKNHYHQQNSHASDMATDDGDFLAVVLNESRSMNNMTNNYHRQNSHASDMADDDSDCLEVVLNESKRMNNMKNNFPQQNSHGSDMAVDLEDIFARDLHETNWEDRSPLGGYSLEEPLSISDYLIDSNSFDRMDINKDHPSFGDAIGALFR